MNEISNNQKTVNEAHNPRLRVGDVSTRFFCHIHVAENNDYGSPTGKAMAISFGSMADFEPDNFNGYAFRMSENRGHKRIHVSGKIYPIKEVSWHVGNIIWNAYKIDTVSATALFNQLIKSGKWYMTGGAAEIDDIIESDGVLLDGDFVRIWKEWHS